MVYEKDQLVRHPKIGLGKVLSIEGTYVTVFFKDADSNPKTFLVDQAPLEILADQSDPWIDNLDVDIGKSGSVRSYITHRGAVDKFLRKFPLGFEDRQYFQEERDYKWEAHILWNQSLDRPQYHRLLKDQAYSEITQRILRVESKVNLLSVYEKAALRDGVKDSRAAETFANGLFDLIYGEEVFENRFARFIGVLDGLPHPKTDTSKWTIMTLFPFLALPKEHLFLKPEVTQEAARRRAFSLNYQPRPNWLTYSCLLRFGKLLMEDLAELKPRDMIDIQSFIWVTGEKKVD